MPSTLDKPKAAIVDDAHAQMRTVLPELGWSLREKLALACQILFDGGHDSGLAGQITCRTGIDCRFHTQPLGLGFDEIRPSNLLEVDEDLNVVHGAGMANPANRFHTWIYRARPDVNCIVHTHPLHVAALSMLGTPLVVSHMDLCPLYGNCAFLREWPGIPVGNEEGELITRTLGTHHVALLAHHGQVSVGRTIEEACVLALLVERAARLQLLASAAGEIQTISPELAVEAREWISTEKRHAAAFAYYARRVLRSRPDCLV